MKETAGDPMGGVPIKAPLSLPWTMFSYGVIIAKYEI
jgi:hypothetical protein